MVNYWQQHSSSQGTIDAVTNFDGLIEIGILESRSSAQVLSVYDINPKAGTIKLAREAHLASGANVSVEPLPAGAHISQCSDETNSSVSSPDSRFVAVCVRDPERSSVVVMDILGKNQ